MVKLEMIFFKTGYARVPKVLNITGLLKDWDVKSQSFRVGSAEATTKGCIGTAGRSLHGRVSMVHSRKRDGL